MALLVLLAALCKAQALRLDVGVTEYIEGLLGAWQKACCSEFESVTHQANALVEAGDNLASTLSASLSDPYQADEREEFARLRARLAELTEALGMATPYPVTDVLTQLADAAEHLLHDHSCDTLGHEGIRDAMLAARRICAALKAKS